MYKNVFLSVLSFLFLNIIAYALPSGFTLTTVTSGLNQAITIRFAPDGRMFYLDQYVGQVRIMSNVSGNYVLNPTPWATIAVDSIAGSERGLLGICFDPNFTTNHYIYFYHSVSGSYDNRVIRLTEDTTTHLANPLSIVTVLEITDSNPATNHNGGNLTFGPDTMLYITVGDGGGSPGTRSQDTTIFQGKILHVNPYGTLPVPYIIPSQLFYCLGLRNSFDMAWNPVNNVLYASENGPTENDEINRIVLGGNYGWPTVEGYSSDTRFINPIFDFSSTTTVAPTGICFYPASGYFPAKYHNDIFLVDVNYGNIWHFKLMGANLDSIDTANSDLPFGRVPPYTYADIEPGPDGNLYLAAFTSIQKLSYTVSVDQWMLYDQPMD